MKAVKGGEGVYITLSDLVQILILLCEVIATLLLALDYFKGHKK